MAAPLPRELRQRAVDARESGQTDEEVANRLQVSPASVKRWHARWLATGSFEPTHIVRKGKRMKLSEEDEDYIEAWVLEDPSRTRDELAALVAKERGIDGSVATVGRALRRLGYSRKRGSPSGGGAIRTSATGAWVAPG